MEELRHDAQGLQSLAVAWCLLVNERLPFLKYLGFALWVGWFGVAYSTPSWISATAVNLSPVFNMFTLSTAGHVLGLFLIVLLSSKFRDVVQRPWLVGVSGLLAVAGCVAVVVSSPDFMPSEQVFVVGCIATGLGTAAFAVNGGLLLCELPPRQALSTLLDCEVVAAAVQLAALGLPHRLTLALFIVLPALSAGCFLLALMRPTPERNRESSRLKPSGAFVRFLLVIFVLALTSHVIRGMYAHSASPAELQLAGADMNLLVLALCAVLAVGLAGSRRLLRFTAWFYPAAALVVLMLLMVFLFPGWLAGGIVLSSAVFQMLDIVLWYAFALVVYQAKVWATLVIATGRIMLSAGVTAGNLVGGYCFFADDLGTQSPLFFILLFAVILVVFLFFPESQAARMLLPIPDEDAPVVEPMGADAVEALQVAGPGATVALGADALSAEAGDGSALGEPSAEARAGGPEGGDGLAVAALRSASPVSAGKGMWRARALRLAEEAGLTEREKEVFLLLARGQGSQSISDQLVVSLYTTRAHIRNIYTKLDVHSRQELVDRVNAVQPPA